VQATLVEDDEMVQTFPSDRANEALAIRILPRGVKSGEHLVNPHRMGGCRERLAINSVAIAQQVAWCTIPGEGLDQTQHLGIGGRTLIARASSLETCPR